MKPILLLFLIVIAQSAFAQNNNQKNEKLLVPSEEKFQPSTHLVSPWRSSGCNRIRTEICEPNCYIVRTDIWRQSNILTIYNADGTHWYRFSLQYESSDYFLKNKEKDFLPFATPWGYDAPPAIVLLRMVGESENWYEVEVNEKTRATKFVLKSDPMWATTKWSYWLFETTNLRLGNKHHLRDKPEGSVIEESADYTFDKVKLLKVEGDWAYVEGFVNSTAYRGWIRWRKGRDILVGCLYNDGKFPEAKFVTEDM